MELSNQELIDTIQGAVLNTPTAFNSQTSRVVSCWMKNQMPSGMRLLIQSLKKVTPADAFEGTKERLKGFAQAKGTILFYEDQDVVKGSKSNPTLCRKLPNLVRTRSWNRPLCDMVGFG